jgi:glutathione S-transferase
MAELTLYSSKGCPFAHRSRLVLAEKKVAFDLVEVDLRNKRADFAAVSGYGKVPAIQHGETKVWESAVINEYLDEVFPEPRLLPQTAGARAAARIWIDYANTRLVSAFGTLLRGKNELERDKAREELQRILSYIEHEGLAKLSPEGPFFLGNQPSLVDFTFYPWFERWAALDHYRRIPIPAEHARLNRYLAATRELESVRSQQNPLAFYVERYGRQVKPELVTSAPN